MDERRNEVNLRIMGEKEAIEAFVKFLEKHFRFWVSGPFKNQRDPGFRCYINLKVRDEL